MSILNKLGWPEKRSAPPSGATLTTAHNFLQILGLGDVAASGINVTVEKALGVPAVFTAVNFISGTIAGLPLNVYQKEGDDRVKVDSSLSTILHDAPNEELTSFSWRKSEIEKLLTTGRSFTFIERNAVGRVVNLWPLDPAGVTISRGGNPARTIYTYVDGSKTTHRYEAKEIIDIPFMMKPDGLGHYSPISTNRDVIALAIAATEYGSKFFQGGGVPPFAVTGNFTTAKGMERASNDLQKQLERNAGASKLALILPEGLKLERIGSDVKDSQLVELKRFLIEEIARIYSLPPVFLQDLKYGTLSNTEQQDLHVTKHTIKRWVEAIEQELNLKLFGRNNNKIYVEFNMDGLLRGDFKTRMDGYATGINTGQITPNEARRMENRSDKSGGDQLLIQGAMIPLNTANQLENMPNDATA